VSDSLDRAEFLAQLEARLAQGEREYGNKSFHKSFAQLRDELLQEYLDVAGWAYISWRKAKIQLARTERGVAHLSDDLQEPEATDEGVD
jgi:hypothetical protein